MYNPIDSIYYYIQEDKIKRRTEKGIRNESKTCVFHFLRETEEKYLQKMSFSQGPAFTSIYYSVYFR